MCLPAIPLQFYFHSFCIRIFQSRARTTHTQAIVAQSNGFTHIVASMMYAQYHQHLCMRQFQFKISHVSVNRARGSHENWKAASSKNKQNTITKSNSNFDEKQPSRSLSYFNLLALVTQTQRAHKCARVIDTNIQEEYDYEIPNRNENENRRRERKRESVMYYGAQTHISQQYRELCVHYKCG